MNAMTLQRPQVFWVLVVASLLIYTAVIPKPNYNIKEVSAIEARELIDAGAVVIDVRERPDLRLPGALLLPQAALEVGVAKVNLAKTAPIVVYCGDGSSIGPKATATLNRAGYTNAVNLKSGFQGWQAAGLPTAKP